MNHVTNAPLAGIASMGDGPICGPLAVSDVCTGQQEQTWPDDVGQNNNSMSVGNLLLVFYYSNSATVAEAHGIAREATRKGRPSIAVGNKARHAPPCIF